MANQLPTTLGKWSLVVAVNNEQVLKSTLLLSPAIKSNCQLICKTGFSTAGQAYNSGLVEAENDLVVFAHQDVFLPEGWTHDLALALEKLHSTDPNWGVLGVFGVTWDQPRCVGYCYSTGLRRVLGGAFSDPIKARSVDEVLLVVRRSSALQFDGDLPGFHLYGADICASASLVGLSSYIVPAFCVHNSNGLKSMPLAFWRAYLYLRSKWKDRLPLATCCTSISSSCMPMFRQMIADMREKIRPSREPGHRVEDIMDLYRTIAECTPDFGDNRG
jgi:hypothetical protein